MVQKNPGGGGMSKKVEVGQRTGAPSRATSPESAAQLGISTHFPKKPVETGRGYTGAAYGNELATNVGKGGPGTGRTLYGQGGTQGLHGAPAPGHSVPAKDILSSYGPDRKV